MKKDNVILVVGLSGIILITILYFTLVFSFPTLQDYCEKGKFAMFNINIWSSTNCSDYFVKRDYARSGCLIPMKIDTYIYSTLIYNQSQCDDMNKSCELVNYANETITIGKTSYWEYHNGSCPF